jgi:protein SCO1/2
MNDMVRGAALSTLLLALPVGAHAGAVLDEAEALRIGQAAIGHRLDDHRFHDTERREVTFADFRGKPVVVNLVYTACSNVCPLVIQTLYDAVERAQEALGQESFAVVTIGFDSIHDTPERMRAYARSQGIDLPGWRFLAADADTIERLTDQLGFVVFPSAQGFDHMAQTTIVDQDGVIYRQVYGGDFEVPAIVEPLKQLVFGRRSDWTSIEGLVNRVRLFCTLYDPRSERYRFDYSVVIGILIGAGSLSAVAIFLVREWRSTERTKTHA